MPYSKLGVLKITNWLFVHLSVNCVLCFGVSTRTMFIMFIWYNTYGSKDKRRARDGPQWMESVRAL